MLRNFPTAFRKSLLFRRRQRLLAERIRLYAHPPASISAHQLERLNAVWRRCLGLPFYAAWAREHQLPRTIGSIAELDHFPVLTRRIVAERSREIFADGGGRSAISTGGSTGEPARFPVGLEEADDIWADLYATRSWWGLAPFDRQALVWGHSHLFGQGAAAALAKSRRWLADRAINALRIDAYDMSDAALARHLADIEACNPVFAVGYTSALFRIARRLAEEGRPLRATNLRAVIATAETVSDADIDVIEAAFGVPVVIEYGAAEAGIIACSRGGSRPMQVLWHSCILTLPGGEVRLTTLGPRRFPLINYAPGDRARPVPGEGRSVTQLLAIDGREQDYVELPVRDGPALRLSAILLVHILKGLPEIRSVAFARRDAGLDIFVELDGVLDEPRLRAHFGQQLHKDHPQAVIDGVRFHQVGEQLRTRAGKHVLMRP